MTIKGPRMSSLPLVSRCPASFKETAKVGVRVSRELARAGTMRHIIAAHILQSGDGPDAKALARQFHIEESAAREEIEALGFLAGRNEGWEVASEITVRLVIDGVEIEGHVDFAVANADQSRIEVVDLKTGRGEVDPANRNWQLLSYIVALSADLAPGGTMAGYLAYTRIGSVSRDVSSHDRVELTAEEIAEVAAELRQIVLAAVSESPEYRPGVHCRFCEARHQCPALNRVLAPVVTQAAEPPRSLRELSAGERGRAIAFAKVLESFAKDVLDQAREIVDTDGPIDLGGGEWFAKSPMPRREINAEAGWQALSDHCGPHLANAVTIPIGAAADAAVAWYAERNPRDTKRGWKGKAKAALMGELYKAGAISVKESWKYTITKALPGPEKDESDGEAG